MVLCIRILYFPELRNVAIYVKVYTYFTILRTKCVQDWYPITVINVHEFLSCVYNNFTNSFLTTFTYIIL